LGGGAGGGGGGVFALNAKKPRRAFRGKESSSGRKKNGKQTVF